MEDSLQNLYQRLSLTEKENEEVVVEPEKLADEFVSSGRCLILKLFTERHYHREIFKGTMRKAWHLVLGVKFRDLDSTLMLAEFESIKDKEKVLRGGPWSFDNHLVLMAEVDGRSQVHQIKLTTAAFWVRIHDLPLMARTEYVGRLLGSKMGTVEEVDVEAGDMKWGQFLRVRVLLPVDKPLLRGSKFTIGGREPVWVSFSYERLPIFCYRCGCLGHSERECVNSIRGPELVSVKDFPYGMWLRAGTRAGVQPSMVENRGRNPVKLGSDSSPGISPDSGSKEVASTVVVERGLDMVMEGGASALSENPPATKTPAACQETVIPKRGRQGHPEQGEKLRKRVNGPESILNSKKDPTKAHNNVLRPGGPAQTGLNNPTAFYEEGLIKRPDGVNSKKWKRTSVLHETTKPGFQKLKFGREASKGISRKRKGEKTVGDSNGHSSKRMVVAQEPAVDGTPVPHSEISAVAVEQPRRDP
ncbi:hypothetical protein F2P56_014601 [Juglans regia]|uniref:CCHC-type domain-containing protein n=1 Tax=Juglans regia TaxID=51240 RepID=A0A834CLK7_JUGRE|nr:hypothetical protein F2P56_014601 [Juglans regia]